MPVFRKSPLCVLFLSLFVLACTEEGDKKDKQTCDVEGAFECLENADGSADHRSCIAYEWVESKCQPSQVCLANACVAQADVCEKTAKRCLDTKKVEVCSASEVVKVETCGEDFICDAVACASGGDCCVAGRICTETKRQCSGINAVIVCTASEPVKLEACAEGLVCDDEACAEGKECCVSGIVCKSTISYCLDHNTASVCVASEMIKQETCGVGFICDAEACGRGEKCCVAGGICTETANRCLDMHSGESCVKGQMPGGLLCGEGTYCDAEACASGKDCCVLGEICVETENTCVDENTLKTCVKDQIPSEQLCEHGGKCVSGECVLTNCSNNFLDDGEEAVDCGGTCAPCVKCRIDTDCGENGFCDSAFGYVCSKRCRTNADCTNSEAWDGNYCRGDGRCSPKVFETVWEPTNEALTVVLPFNTKHPGAQCDFQILWGDEVGSADITKAPRVTDCARIQNRTHKYSQPGSYHVKIIGIYDGWSVELDEVYEKPMEPAPQTLVAVQSFGSVGLGVNAFYGAQMLSIMPKQDVPDATKLKSLERCFYTDSAFNASIGHWDVSNVTNMYAMLCNATIFNQPVGQWNTSKVTDISYVFAGAEAFNQPIGDWNTACATDMTGMFNEAFVFNQPLDAWDTSSVTCMSQMFLNASVFNQAIGVWDVSQVTDMMLMLGGTSAFDQDLSGWHLSDLVTLAMIFSKSGISESHLCALKAKGGAWLTQWTDLAKDATCK